MPSRHLTDLLRSLAANARRLRDAQDLTQEALAERVPIELRYLKKIESAKATVSLDVLVRLADALGVRADRLLRAGTKLPKAKRGRPPRRSDRATKRS